MTFKESDALSPGNSFTIFRTPGCDVGVGICYDIRFAELAQVYAQKGCKLLVYPGAFNMTTGKIDLQKKMPTKNFCKALLIGSYWAELEL